MPVRPLAISRAQGTSAKRWETREQPAAPAETRQRMEERLSSPAAGKANRGEIPKGAKTVEEATHATPTRSDLASTVSGSGTGEPEPTATPLPEVAEAMTPPISSRARGKGGLEHKAIQSMIRRVAEGLGFRALIEHATGSGHSSVDLVLVRGHTKIACEVSVTTSPEHELANLRKCLAEPFSLVALLAEDPNHRSKLRELAAKEFPPEELERVRFLSCDEFVEHLGTIAIGGTKESGEKRVRGYRVKRKFAELSPEERRAVSKQAFCLLAEEMKQPPSLSA